MREQDKQLANGLPEIIRYSIASKKKALYLNHSSRLERKRMLTQDDHMSQVM